MIASIPLRRLLERTMFATSIAILTACGGSGDSGVPSGPVSGEWHGTTAQGKTLSFRLSDGVLTEARLSYNTNSPGCSSRSKTTFTGLSERIVNNALAGSFTVGGPNPDTITYSAQFAGSSNATGTLTVSGSCGRASTTFSATPGAATNTVAVANAGVDQTVSVGTRVTLNGDRSEDAENDTLTPTWTLDKPAGSAAQLASAGTMNPSFTPDLPGTYTVRLVVNDGSADSAPDTVVVTANGLSLDGDWTGTNSAGKPLTFTVVNGKITKLSISYAVLGNFCSAEGTISTNFSTPLNINVDHFIASSTGSGPSAVSYTMSGTFANSTTASGTLFVSFNQSFPNPTCSGSSSTTWTASR